MNFKCILASLGIFLFPGLVIASDSLFQDNSVIDGIEVAKVSDVFADIYEKLDGVNWAGKNINVAIENLESLNPQAHIAATGERVVLVWGDELIANYPYPSEKNWQEYGQITTALIMQMREHDSRLRSLRDVELYDVVVNALLSGVDENGSYIYSKDMINNQDTKILTSIGFDGGRDERGNFRVTGVFKDSPADMAGIREGAIISEINGQRVSKMTDSDISAVLSGYNSGTSKLKLLTPTGNKNVTLRRATVILADADVIHRSDANSKGGFLEIVVHKISDGAVNIINEALNKYKDTEGIILDLRTSSGDDEKAAGAGDRARTGVRVRRACRG